MNEPAVPGPLVRICNTTYSHDYTFRLVREAACRVSQGAQIAACSASKHNSNNNKTGRLKSPVSWDTAGDDKVVTYMFGGRQSSQRGHNSTLAVRLP